MLIVTGAHLRAEASDRPLAYELAELMRPVIESLAESGEGPPRPLVCSDLWYLNTTDLHRCPVVSVGSPGVNALTAYLTERLPALFTVDHSYTVQMDLEAAAPVASCWGTDEESTASAVRVFIDKYMDEFLRSALRALGL